MSKYEVIPAVLWRRDDGASASIYGALPWRSEAEKARWKREEVGFTVRNPHTNEVGIGRAPWATRGEAEAFAAKHLPSRICIGD